MKILHARNRAINRRWEYPSWMNRGLICLFISTIFLPAIAMAELQQSIVLKTVNKPLKAVLEEIRLQTKVELIGDTYSLRDALPVTIDVKNTDLTKVLKDISKEQPVDITFHNNTIIVRNKSNSQSRPNSDKDQEGIVKGFVIDSLSGERLSGVNVSLVSSKIGGVTSGSGSFSIHYRSASDAILVTCVGYRTRSIPIRSVLRNSVIKLVQISNQIQETVIQHKNTQNVTIDLNRKRHMNLGQILEGSVPGVVLKPKITTKKEIIISNAGNANTGRFNNEREKFEYLKSIRSPVVDQYQTYEDYERDLLMNWSRFVNRGDAMALNQETTLGGIEIESRGGAIFPGSTKGMLILIDGFPQSDFPANMPMSNVESVEVIRDPEECIKYGQAGINGVVLIKTMAGKAGKPEIRFSSNIFLAQKPDISLKALELASSEQLLDFYDEQYQKKIFPFSFDDFPTNNVPYAYNLLYDRLKSKVTEEVFQSKWDSLKTINNRGQLQSLYQRRFMQQYNLGVSGSGKGILFNVNALHSRQKQETRGNENALLDLNSNTQFNFFKNKLDGNVFVRYKTGESRNPKTSGTIRAPYQLLFDANGNYIYDYSDTFREDLNADYVSKGLLDHGRNLYQDQILNFVQNNTKEYFATAKVNYQVSPHLKWMNSFLFQNTDYEGLTFTDLNSSEARQFYNTYTATSKANPLMPWLPLANKGILTGSRSKTMDARSGIAYDRALSKNHRLQAGISAWMSLSDYKADSTRTLYGIDKYGHGGDTLLIEGKKGTNLYREAIADDNLAMVYQSLDREDRNLKLVRI